MAESVFVQSLVYVDDSGEEELDLSFMLSCSYIESVDLSAPKLIVKINDREEIFREEYGLAAGGTIRATLADPYLHDETGFDEDFIILTMPVDERDIITLNCLSSVVHGLKQPAVSAQFFVDKSAQDILALLVPGVELDVASLPVAEPYHLTPGMRPSRLIRQMAREQGCLAFYRRGTLMFQPIESFLDAPASFEYHYNDSRAEYRLMAYRQTGGQTMTRDRLGRHYTGWHITDAELDASGTAGEHPAESTGLTSLLTLDNMAKAPVHVLEAFTGGNARLQAGDLLDLIYHRGNVESPLLENMPEKIIIGTVTHHYSAQKYVCRVKGVLPCES